MYDYHTHSSFSDDCPTPMEELIKTAVEIGIREIAVTDHYDPDSPEIDCPNELDFPRYHQNLTEMKEKYRDRIKVLKGVEIGLQESDKTLEKCRAAANSYDYDYILGAFHFAEGHDIYHRHLFENKTVEEAYIVYYTMVRDCLRKYKDFDVLAHFNIIDRYPDHIADWPVYAELAEEILKIVIADGKGLEINTSSSRYGMGERTIPSEEILRLYAELGGEIVTIGSDAHRAKDVGYRLRDAAEMLRSAGFRYLTLFEERKPRFIKLESL